MRPDKPAAAKAPKQKPVVHEDEPPSDFLGSGLRSPRSRSDGVFRRSGSRRAEENVGRRLLSVTSSWILENAMGDADRAIRLPDAAEERRVKTPSRPTAKPACQGFHGLVSQAPFVFGSGRLAGVVKAARRRRRSSGDRPAEGLKAQAQKGDPGQRRQGHGPAARSRGLNRFHQSVQLRKAGRARQRRCPKGSSAGRRSSSGCPGLP